MKYTSPMGFFVFNTIGSKNPINDYNKKDKKNEVKEENNEGESKID